MVFISLLSENATNHEYSPEAWFLNSLQPGLDNGAVVREDELIPWNWGELGFLLAHSLSSCDIGQLTYTLCAFI